MMEELKQLGFEPILMMAVRNPVTKQLMSMFFVDLKPSQKNAEIYNLKRLYHAVIKVEPPKPRRTVIQCSRCQEYNHTKNFCRQKPRCKCEGMQRELPQVTSSLRQLQRRPHSKLQRDRLSVLPTFLSYGNLT